MKIKVICTSISTTLTITTPSGSGPFKLEQMPNGAASPVLPSLGPGTTTPVKVGPGAYKIIGDGLNVTADPNPAGEVQILEVGKTDPPEALKLTLTAAPFTQSQLNAFIGLGRGAVVPPPR